MVFDTGYPSHYDPLKNPRRPGSSSQKYLHPIVDSEPGMVAMAYPRGCKRQIQLYYQCVYANSKEKCGEEGNRILSICPNFVLDGLRERNLQKIKTKHIDNLLYKEAMTVSEYNVGRTIANISKKNWLDGSSDKLRADTMWADDRYVDITQKEINEAKERVAQRKARHAKHDEHKHDEHKHDDHGHGHDDHHYDWKHISMAHAPPLYP